MAAISAVLRAGPCFLPAGRHLSFSAAEIYPRHRSSALFPLFSAFSSPILSVDAENFDPLSPFSYGPSLRKGLRRQPPSVPGENGGDEGSDNPVVDRESFTRVFLLSALRVPASRCAELESRLRGHLLNWPRVRNVARVSGDELDPDVAGILSDRPGDEDRLGAAILRESGESSDGEGNQDLGREMLSPVLYREKLAKEFNHRGFLKFRNLAKLSRPRKRKKEICRKGTREEGEVGTRRGKSDFASIELVESTGREDEEEGHWRRLIGDGFSGERWRGPTRLLLLDERYADRGPDDLPEAIKALMRGERSEFDLVQCRLTLFYEYWSANEILEELLPDGVVVPSAFETVGHVAHLNLRDEHFPFRKLIAQVLLDKNRPKIQTVVNKTDVINSDFRTMPLEILAGNHSLLTTVVEGGARFQVNLATVYWNSRLATERQRLVGGFNNNDVVYDVFAGAGPIAVAAAKKVRRVYANDLNPAAAEFLRTNISLNKLERKVHVFNMDGRRFIDTVFSSEMNLPSAAAAAPAAHVVMNLPNDAADFLDVFRGIFRRGGGAAKRRRAMPTIHVYGFSKSQDPEFDFRERIAVALCCELQLEVDVHRVRLVAPSKWMLCASFLLPPAVAFAPTTEI